MASTGDAIRPARGANSAARAISTAGLAISAHPSGRPLHLRRPPRHSAASRLPKPRGRAGFSTGIHSSRPCCAGRVRHRDRRCLRGMAPTRASRQPHVCRGQATRRLAGRSRWAKRHARGRVERSTRRPGRPDCPGTWPSASRAARLVGAMRGTTRRPAGNQNTRPAWPSGPDSQPLLHRFQSQNSPRPRPLQPSQFRWRKNRDD